MLKLAVIGGDGIGPEVTDQGLRCLEKLARQHGFDYDARKLPYSGGRYLKENVVITDAEIADLRENYDAIYLGAVGTPDVPPGVVERGLLLKMRFELDQYINLRPVKLLPGVRTPLAGKGPEHIDMVVVRENTEDLYCGIGGFLRKGTPHEVATQEMIATRMGVDRCLKYAFDLTMTRPRKKLTLVGKTNVLTFAHDLWMRAFNEMGEQYPQVTREYHHVDACCMYMVSKPEIYDVIVTTNMFGDIITDLGAAIAGGMGVAASGNLNPQFTPEGRRDNRGGGPGMYEPVHGSAPDIAGQNKANPIAAILSMAMLLRETGRIKGDAKLVAAGEALEAAVVKVCPRWAGQNMDRLDVGTKEVAEAVMGNF
ncbi:MAG: 3-isopropylmalate dehydrogenase [Phycisphaeraceae bacterium]